MNARNDARARISRKDYDRYHLAKEVAKLSDCRFKLGAALYTGKRMMSIACNVLKSHPEHTRKYAANVISIHAEHRAILLSRGNVKGAVMYIARNGGKEISNPCLSCRIYMKEAGIKTIVYFNGTHLVKERL